jgi:hypothetical protein
MENKNFQLSWSAQDLTWSSSPYPAAMVNKRHLGGVATAQYSETPELWTWSQGARVVVVPDVHKEGSLVHRYLQTNVDKLLDVKIIY